MSETSRKKLLGDWKEVDEELEDFVKEGLASGTLDPVPGIAGTPPGVIPGYVGAKYRVFRCTKPPGTPPKVIPDLPPAKWPSFDAQGASGSEWLKARGTPVLVSEDRKLLLMCIDRIRELESQLRVHQALIVDLRLAVKGLQKP